MSTRKSTAELLANAEEASRKARTRVSELKKRHVEEQRKKRTKRLIETGAIIEKVFEMEFDTEDKRKRLGKMARQNVKRYSIEEIGAKWISLLKQIEKEN